MFSIIPRNHDFFAEKVLFLITELWRLPRTRWPCWGLHGCLVGHVFLGALASWSGALLCWRSRVMFSSAQALSQRLSVQVEGTWPYTLSVWSLVQCAIYHPIGECRSSPPGDTYRPGSLMGAAIFGHQNLELGLPAYHGPAAGLIIPRDTEALPVEPVAKGTACLAMQTSVSGRWSADPDATCWIRRISFGGKCQRRLVVIFWPASRTPHHPLTRQEVNIDCAAGAARTGMVSDVPCAPWSISVHSSSTRCLTPPRLVLPCRWSKRWLGVPTRNRGLCGNLPVFPSCP